MGLIKKAGKSKNWKIIDAVQPLLPRQEQVRYAWYGHTGPHPFWILYAFVCVSLILLGSAFFYINIDYRIIIAGVLASGIVLSFLIFSVINFFLRVHRRTVVVTESKKIYVFKLPRNKLTEICLLQELDGLPNTFGPFEGRYTKDQVAGKKFWVSKHFYSEVEAANKHLMAS